MNIIASTHLEKLKKENQTCFGCRNQWTTQRNQCKHCSRAEISKTINAEKMMKNENGERKCT